MSIHVQCFQVRFVYNQHTKKKIFKKQTIHSLGLRNVQMRCFGTIGKVAAQCPWADEMCKFMTELWVFFIPVLSSTLASVTTLRGLWNSSPIKSFLPQADKDSFLNAEYRNGNWFMHKGVSSADSPEFPRNVTWLFHSERQRPRI